MKKIMSLLLVLFLTTIFIGCTKDGSQTQDNAPEFSENQVRSRTLKTAIEDYNKGLYKASKNSIVKARSQRIKQEDIEIMNALEKRIEQKTNEAIKNLESLAVNGEFHTYDFEYHSITDNYELSSFRQVLNELNKKYLARVKQKNDSYLTTYYSYIDELQTITAPRLVNNNKEFISKTRPLKLKIIISGYESPQIFLEFHPSQKEPVLETLQFTSKNITIPFDKQSMTINDYNFTNSKIITFNLLDNDSPINLTNFKQMIKNEKITINLKWFYEPERVSIHKKTISNLKNVLDLFEKLNNQYQANLENIYIPKYVK